MRMHIATPTTTQHCDRYGGVPPRFVEHLVFGETMHPVRVQCANLSVWLMGGNKTHRVQNNLTVPAVAVGTFRGRSRGPLTQRDEALNGTTRGHSDDTPASSSPSSVSGGSFVDAGVGSVIVNVANTTQLATVELGASAANALSLTLFDAHRNPLRKWSSANGSLPPVLNLTLSPFEVVFLLADSTSD
jgi:hypothetical protein